MRITSPTPYASTDDFRRIFVQDKDELSQLSFLLTGDQQKAEQCFVSGLENPVRGNRVFKEWERSWARRAIIQCAVRVIDPRPMEEGSSSSKSSGNTPVLERAIAATRELEPFERFVYVTSVLEHYSDQDCSVLLDCALQNVIAARARALQRMGATELTFSAR